MRPSRRTTIALALLTLTASLFGIFQNCSQGFKSFDPSSALESSGCSGASCPPAPTCAFNGQTLAVGQSVTAFLNASAPCTSQVRTCGALGVLGGSYAFATCATTGQASCLFNGQTIANGATVEAYLSAAPAADGTCATQTRSCANGALSGSYAFATCAPNAPTSCLFDGRTIPNGQSVTAFANGRVATNLACAPQPRTCQMGVLTGAGDYSSCAAGINAPCLFNGHTVADGQTVTAYASSNGTCTPVTRTCANGVLSGAGDFASCDANAGAACLVNGLTISDGAAAVFYGGAFANPGQTCATQTRTCVNGTASGTAAFTSCLARPMYISADYVRPSTREGLADVHYADDPATMNTRYAKFQSMGIGVRIYNIWWSGLEDGTVRSSASPVNCGPSQVMVPASDAEKTARGYHRYRCLTLSDVAQFDAALTHDAAAGIQSAVVFWSAATIYRDPKCAGNTWAGAPLFDGCVPRDDAMDDFEDVLNFLMAHYDGRSGNGKISHLVLWNENASGLWFDYSPTVPNKGTLTAAQQDLWIGKYAAMVTRAHQAIQRNTAGVMLDVSTDLYWAPPKVKATAPAHIGSGVLVNGLWSKLDPSISWSVAVHPYGDIDTAPGAGQYNFLNVQDVVAGNQGAQLAARGWPADSLQHPQSFLIASEQGWPQSEGIDRQAKNVCWAQQSTIESPFIISQTHNYFQSTEPQETTGGSSGQGAFFGLLPYRSAVDLSDMTSFSTGAAYLASSPAAWGKDANNWCCVNAGVGCPVPSGTQWIFRSFGSNHFYSPRFVEGPRAGFKPESAGFGLYPAVGADLVPLYRCMGSTGDTILTTSATCEGYGNQAVVGYVHQTAAAGLVPLYRRVSSTAPLDHLVTLNANEGSPGYRTESILGYLPQP